MSLIGKLFGGPSQPVAARVEPSLSAASGNSVSDGEGHKGWMGGIGWHGGQSRVRTLPPVSASVAQRHATVYACCNVIAGDLAKITLKLYRRRDDGQEERVRDHPATYLLNVESSPGVPAIVARYMLAYAFALRGNAYAYAPRDGGGELELIDAIRQDGCSVLRVGRARFYDFEDGAGIRRRVASRQMVHLRHMAEDGWTGRSPIEVAAESMGLALAGQEAAARMSSGTLVRAYVKMKDVFEDDEAYRRNGLRVRAALNDPEANGFPIISENDSIERLDLSSSDQELLASRRFDREMIASIYRVPPPKLQILEYGVKANSEQAAIDYLTDCLLHWGKQTEDQLALALLTPAEREAGFFLRHDFDTLLRPTTKERYEAWAKAVGGPFVTPNEVRRKEGYADLPEGNRLNPAPNMTRKEDGGTSPAKEDEE